MYKKLVIYLKNYFQYTLKKVPELGSWQFFNIVTRKHIEVSESKWSFDAFFGGNARVPSSEKYPIQAQSQLKSCGLNFDGLT